MFLKLLLRSLPEKTTSTLRGSIIRKMFRPHVPNLNNPELSRAFPSSCRFAQDLIRKGLTGRELHKCRVQAVLRFWRGS